MIDRLFTLEGIGQLLGLPFVQSALLACAVLGLVAGALAPLIVSRGMAFAVHGTAELAFTGGRRGAAGRGERQPRGGGRGGAWPGWCSACSGCASASATR